MGVGYDEKFCVVMACGIFFLFSLFRPGAEAPQEAKALVEKAIAFYKANARKRHWRNSVSQRPIYKRRLYIFAYNPTGTIIAHGGDPKLVEKTLPVSRT